MATYKYEQLESVAVDIEDHVITLNMYTAAPEEQKCFIFETVQKEDIAHLIASYSPAHSSWQRVGDKKTKTVKLCTSNLKNSNANILGAACNRERQGEDMG